MSFAALEDRSANERTSSATTANPRPMSPARVASLAAFSASRLVWSAICEIVSVIAPISSPLSLSSSICVDVATTASLIPCIASAVSTAACLPSTAAVMLSWLFSAAAVEEVLTLLRAACMPSLATLAVFTLAVCSEAPEATPWIACAISVEAELIWSLLAASCTDDGPRRS